MRCQTLETAPGGGGTPGVVLQLRLFMSSVLRLVKPTLAGAGFNSFWFSITSARRRKSLLFT